MALCAVAFGAKAYTIPFVVLNQPEASTISKLIGLSGIPTPFANVALLWALSGALLENLIKVQKEDFYSINDDLSEAQTKFYNKVAGVLKTEAKIKSAMGIFQFIRSLYKSYH